MRAGPHFLQCIRLVLICLIVFILCFSKLALLSSRPVGDINSPCKPTTIQEPLLLANCSSTCRMWRRHPATLHFAYSRSTCGTIPSQFFQGCQVWLQQLSGTVLHAIRNTVHLQPPHHLLLRPPRTTMKFGCFKWLTRSVRFDSPQRSSAIKSTPIK